MRILIAEDDPLSRRLLASVLEKMGHEVVATENGHEAWSAFVVERPRVVITDWMMPFMDGLELCQKVRSCEQFQYVYIIMITALGEREFYLEGMGAGADDFITKPFNRDELGVRLTVAERLLKLQEEVSQLKGLLPICAYCKKIRDEQQEWRSLEEFVSSKTETEFSHAYCPDCEREVSVGRAPAARERDRKDTTA
jgi:sigma-B regulation protein RsbU (phosphoserine phosphatase)